MSTQEALDKAAALFFCAAVYCREFDGGWFEIGEVSGRFFKCRGCGDSWEEALEMAEAWLAKKGGD